MTKSEYINNSLHLARKYSQIFVRGNYLFREGKTVSFEEQIMFKNKYPGIFSRLMEAVVFIILQIFFAIRAVLKIMAIFKNYSPKRRWLAVDIYQAAKLRSKYQTLATDTELKSCFSIY